jgi:hypothetical protein
VVCLPARIILLQLHFFGFFPCLHQTCSSSRCFLRASRAATSMALVSSCSTTRL